MPNLSIKWKEGDCSNHSSFLIKKKTSGDSEIFCSHVEICISQRNACGQVTLNYSVTNSRNFLMRTIKRIKKTGPLCFAGIWEDISQEKKIQAKAGGATAILNFIWAQDVCERLWSWLSSASLLKFLWFLLFTITVHTVLIVLRGLICFA